MFLQIYVIRSNLTIFNLTISYDVFLTRKTVNLGDNRDKEDRQSSLLS